MKTKRTFQCLSLLLVFSFIASFQSCKKEDNHKEVKISAQVPNAHDVVMYEVNPRAFASQNALLKITERLDEIKSLGVNVLWIMPIYEEGVYKGKGSPYCIKNYRAIDSEYGTIEDLKKLVKEAHKRNIIVLMDWVANHTAWDNAWITEHDDFYTKDENGNIVPPIIDWSDVADLNYDNMAMRDSMINAMKYWIEETNIDGYRCDAADFVPKNFWETAISELRSSFPKKKLLMLAEGNKVNYFSLGFDMDYGWSLYSRLEKLYKDEIKLNVFIEKTKNELSKFEEDKHRLYFTNNHDKSAWEKTDIQLFNGERGALSAFVLTATLGGSPMIYSTQEIGYANNLSFFRATEIDWDSNPHILNEYKKIMSIYTSSDIFRNKYVDINIDNNNPNIIYYTHNNGKKETLTIINFKNEEQTFIVPEEVIGNNYKNLMDDTLLSLQEELSMTAYQYLILEKQ